MNGLGWSSRKPYASPTRSGPDCSLHNGLRPRKEVVPQSLPREAVNALRHLPAAACSVALVLLQAGDIGVRHLVLDGSAELQVRELDLRRA